MILTTTLYDWWSTVISIPGVKTGLVILLLSMVEISPIKISPWSWVGGLIGKLLGIKSVSDKVDAIEKKVDENQATTIRVRILRYVDEVQNNVSHSKDSWNQVMDDIRRYEIYTEEHPEFKNNITVASINFLKKTYEGLLDKHAWTTHLTSEDRVK